MNQMIFDDHEQLNEAAAAVITGLVQSNPRAVLGLATGGTQVEVYRQVVQTYLRGRISFKNVTTFNLDEYVGLPEDHPESYHTYMKKHFFNHVDFAPERTHIPNGNAADVHGECREYDDRIEKAGGIDLQLLGLGHNGHIGFNEPAPALTNDTHVVELAQETRNANACYFDSLDQVPKQALTMGVETIFNAKTILLVVKGADKADIVRWALSGPITAECPASFLQTHSHLIVLMDREAGRYLG